VTGLIDTIRSHVMALPDLAKFAVVVAAIVGVPRLAARIRLPPMVGLLLFGVALGPHVLGFFGEHRPIANFFAELGKLLLMFSAGLEIDIALFRKALALCSASVLAMRSFRRSSSDRCSHPTSC
jgi:Kef-type K+ transport system membrane component KefB